MRTKLIVVLALLGCVLAPLSASAITLVQSVSKNCGSVTNCSIPFTLDTTPGNFYVIVANMGVLNATTTVATSSQAADTFNLAVAQDQTTQGNSQRIMYAMNVAGGSTTINIHIGGTAKNIRASIAEYTGVATSSALDTATSSQGAASPSNSGNITTATSTELLIGGYTNGNNGATTTLVAKNGFTLETSQLCPVSQCVALEDRITTSTVTVSSSFSWTSGSNWTQTIAAFLPTSTNATVITNVDPFMMADNF